jgi:hypothetical protein
MISSSRVRSFERRPPDDPGAQAVQEAQSADEAECPSGGIGEAPSNVATDRREDQNQWGESNGCEYQEGDGRSDVLHHSDNTQQHSE